MSETRIYVVDRIEGSRAVLVGDDHAEHVLARHDLPLPVAEGVVLRVTVDEGRPDWSSAQADPDEQSRRLAEAQRRMDELRKRDPGGDLEL